MEDRRALSDINEQIRSIERNNQNTLDNMTSIEMLLTSDNNGTTKDSQLTQKINQLKSKIEDTINTTNEIVSMVNKNNNK